MDKYVALEKRLAELLGWKHVQLGGDMEGLNMPNNWLHGIYPVDGKPALVPQWCRDWSACGPLMVGHVGRIHMDDDKSVVAAVFLKDRGHIARVEFISDHPDRDTAVRFAIVQAVIARLESAA